MTADGRPLTVAHYYTNKKSSKKQFDDLIHYVTRTMSAVGRRLSPLANPNFPCYIYLNTQS